MKAVKSWGTAGEVVVSLGEYDPSDFDLEEPVFIDFDELPVPFFIEKITPKGGRCIVKFEDVDSLEASEELVGRKIRFKDDESGEGDESILGITIINAATGKPLGTVTDVSDYSGNTCITVDCNGTEVMLPLHEDLIKKVSEDSLTLVIPEGLI